MELKADDTAKIVWVLTIPKHHAKLPVYAHNKAWQRTGDSLVEMRSDRLQAILSEIEVTDDWSAVIVEDATIDDLDSEAIAYARKMFIRREENRTGASDIIERLSDIEVLNKAGLTFKGQITRTALMLLGKKESSFYFDGFVPRITWTLYNADKSVKAYEHFDMPLLLAVDKVYGKIRNEKYRYIADQTTLFPEEVDQYNPNLVKEIINN